MKKIIIFAMSLCFIGVVGLIVSCDKVETPYMNVVDVSDCPVPTFPDFPAPAKTVLIEEFTAHKCTYCPTGAYNIQQIQQQAYGDRVIVLGIHSSGLADPEPGNFSLDLRPEDHGNDLYADFLVPAEPRAMFNRAKLDGTNILYDSPTTWQAKAEQVLAETPVLSMQIINDYDASTRKLCAHVKTKFLTASSQNLKIAVWISEDSIVGYQLNNNASVGTTPEISNYVFMDVMRDEFVGTYGEVFTTGSVAQDSAIIRSYKKTLNPDWVDSHCKVVAYVYDVNTKEILQAVECKVIE
ncbi:MAG: Omp28-related outer membrane protein [Bacteroidota bacterium]